MRAHPLLPTLFASTVLAVVLTSCATAPPPAGATQPDLLLAWGPPTARYDMPDGTERLEYASGPYGRTTWMVDLDRAGRVTQARQMLNEREFLQVQSTPGLTREALLRWLGRPGETRGGGRAGGEVWSWRYPTNDCLWFQVSLGDDGRVGSSGYFVDPRCDGPSDARH
jgi:hypothetical protein